MNIFIAIDELLLQEMLGINELQKNNIPGNRKRNKAKVRVLADQRISQLMVAYLIFLQNISPLRESEQHTHSLARWVR